MVKKIECRVINSRPRSQQNETDSVGPKPGRPQRNGTTICEVSACAHTSQENGFVPARSNAHTDNHIYVRTPAIPRGMFVDAWA